jgi:manganese/zinc/iron transport system ATP- binding protein
VVEAGPTDTVFTEENLRKTYGGKLTLLSDALFEYSKNPQLPRGRKGGEP